jgi:hypothetical protein
MVCGSCRRVLCWWPACSISCCLVVVACVCSHDCWYLRLSFFFSLFIALLPWLFFFSGCYSSYLVYFCRGVFGFFVVEIMVVKPETSLVNAPMTYVKNGKNYSYWARLVEVFFKGKGWFPHLTSCNPEGIAPSLWEHEDNQIISFILNSSSLTLDPHASICLLPIILVLEISLGFIRCVNNILGLNKVLSLWMSTIIRLWPSVRRGTCTNRSLHTCRKWKSNVKMWMRFDFFLA